MGMSAEEYACYSVEDRLIFSARMSSASKEDCELMNEAAEEIARLRNIIIKAVDLAQQCGQIDGSHHKMWVIDQMVRILVPDNYEAWVKKAKEGEDGPETYSWNCGIAP